jgi:hypothetical protein
MCFHALALRPTSAARTLLRGGGWETGPRSFMFWNPKNPDPPTERVPSAFCPECQSPDHVPRLPIVNADERGEWAVGSIRDCLNCRHRFSVVKGRVFKPQWMLDEERAREKDAEQRHQSIDQLREKFRNSNGTAQRETDFKW